MTIEFRCQDCNKLLRTSDDRAGARAKCPDCGARVTVPQAAGAADDEFDYGDIEEEDYDSAYPPQREDRYDDSGYASDTKDCPMCGAEIKAAAVKCRHCGEMLDGSPGRGGRGDSYSTKIEAGEVISTSWEIFKSEMGLLVGGMLLFNIIVVGVILVLYVVFAMAIFAVIGARNFPTLIVVVLLLYGALVLLITYFQSGRDIFLLNVARGTNAEIGDFFKGGRHFMRVLGNTLLLGLAFIGMYFICVLPMFLIGRNFVFVSMPLIWLGAIILSLMYWPFQFVIVDDNAPHRNALSRAKELTSGNWGAVFLLMLAAFGINLLGMLACGFGMLFSGPLTELMFAVAYCRMAGRRTALER